MKVDQGISNWSIKTTFLKGGNPMKKMILFLLFTTSAWAVEYAIQVKQKNGSVTTVPLKEINKLVLPLTTTAVAPEVMENLQTAIKTFSLLQNYPNPFNPSTVIAVTLPRAGQASVTIYDLSGRQVRKLDRKSVV